MIVGVIGVIAIVAGVAAVVIVVMMNRGVFTPPMPDTPSVAEAPRPQHRPGAAAPGEAETPAPPPARASDPSTRRRPSAQTNRPRPLRDGPIREPPTERTRPRGEVASRERRPRRAWRDAPLRQPSASAARSRGRRKLRDVKPIYPPIAVAARVQGVVIIEATIDPDGKVSEARVLRSIPLLDQAALEAVRQWEYTPTLLNGEAVPVIMTVTANFTLR